MRFRRVGCVLIILAVVGALLFAVFYDGNLYTHTFGDHTITVWIGAPAFGCINGSYHSNYALLQGFNSVRLPQKYATPTFTTIHEPADKLICVYDNQRLGFIMMVDQSDDEWFMGGMSAGYPFSPMTKWSGHFATLQLRHPFIPYAHYFAPGNTGVPANTGAAP